MSRPTPTANYDIIFVLLFILHTTLAYYYYDAMGLHVSAFVAVTLWSPNSSTKTYLKTLILPKWGHVVTFLEVATQCTTSIRTSIFMTAELELVLPTENRYHTTGHSQLFKVSQEKREMKWRSSHWYVDGLVIWMRHQYYLRERSCTVSFEQAWAFVQQCVKKECILH